MTDAMERLRRAMKALAREMGDGWAVVEGEPYPAIGVGESSGYRRIALIHEEPPHPPTRRGLEIWSQGGDWRWVVDDGHGLLHTAQGSSLPRVMEAAWERLWAMAVDPLTLVVELLRNEASEPWSPGTPRVMGRRVWWGQIEILVRPMGGAGDEGWPLVRHGAHARHLRQACYPAELAARLAGLAIRYAMRLSDAEEATRGPAGFGAAGVYCSVPVEAPPLPAAVSDACGVIGAIVDDWRSRLRTALAAESQRVWEARRRRIDQRAPAVFALPGENLDPFGRELDHARRPVGNARLEVPVEVVAALWALGLPLRWISEVTTGRDTSRNTVHRWIQQLEAAPPGWTGRRVGAALIDEQDLGWARSWHQLALDPPPSAVAERPVPAAGDHRGTPSDEAPRIIRVRRRVAESDRPTPTVVPEGTPPADVRPTPAAGDSDGTRSEPAPPAADGEPLDLHARVAAIDARWRFVAFVNAVPALSQRFIELVRTRGIVSLTEVMEALDIDVPKRLGGVTGPLGRWAPVHGIDVPYKATSIDGERAWQWLGGPGTEAEDADDIEALTAALDAHGIEHELGVTDDLEVSIASGFLVVAHEGIPYLNGARLPMPAGLVEAVLAAVHNAERVHRRAAESDGNEVE